MAPGTAEVEVLVPLPKKRELRDRTISSLYTLQADMDYNVMHALTLRAVTHFGPDRRSKYSFTQGFQ